MTKVYIFDTYNIENPVLVSYVVFARNQTYFQHIVAISILKGVGVFGWTGKEWDLYRRSGEQAQLDAALQSEVEGVGIYSPESGWRIVTADEILNQDDAEPREE